MRLTFRQFVEQEAAPSMGSPSAPANPDSKDNSKHFDALQRQFGMSNRAFDGAMEGGPRMAYVTPNYSSKWGFLVNGAVPIMAKKDKSGQYEVTFMLSQKKQESPYSFILPYKAGQTPMYYDGPVEDKTEMMSPKQLQDIEALPFSMGGMSGGMGGGPPMGGMGAPPMGGPPMGGM